MQNTFPWKNNMKKVWKCWLGPRGNNLIGSIGEKWVWIPKRFMIGCMFGKLGLSDFEKQKKRPGSLIFELPSSNSKNLDWCLKRKNQSVVWESNKETISKKIVSYNFGDLALSK